MLVILKQLQPYLSAINLSVAPPKQPVNPKISQSFATKKHLDGTSSGVGEVEHLNKMLNNINVQTKKNEFQDGKLPRKIKVHSSFSYQKSLKNDD